ncbi:MAG: glutamate 5-kinase [Dehalococcoidia bacterium]|nr:glutamate 5-kinase [Dehalococcoidia bacterium]
MQYNRIVIKVGTNLLTGGTGKLDGKVMADLVRQAAYLHAEGHELIIVSSGAVAAGREKLGIKNRRKDIPFKQVMASVGQSRLMLNYDELFKKYGITVAQALLTRADLADRAQYLNARNTLLALIDLKVVCIVNENDVVCTDELGELKFGDNDNLSAMVANLVDADLLIILSDVKGLYTTDPQQNPDAKLIPVVEKIDETIEEIAGGAGSSQGTGGMATKIEAARLATSSGVSVIIAHGLEPNVILRAATGKRTGTFFVARDSKLESRQRWLLSGLCCMGKLILDKGAVTALLKKNKSLLPAGIVKIEGNFNRGDVIDFYDTDNNQIGSGITNYSSSDLQKIKGAQSSKIAGILGYEYGDEAVHRNNLVLLQLKG